MTYDKDFLLKLDKTKNKTIYARITALTFDERPIETIEGRVTQGSINVDGASAVRRSCSLTMIAKDFDWQNYYWGLNTKFKLEIGVENFIDSFYPEIIWFKQGIYVFTSFNTSRNTSNFTISLQGKDKMCLLNGEVGGSLESSIDFGTIEEETEEGIWQITKIPIYQIIRNAVHVYGGEPYHNIIINDLDNLGLELLEYRYDIPMYLYRERNSNVFNNITLNGKIPCEILNEDGTVKETGITLDDLTNTDLDVLIDSLMGTSNPSIIRIEGKEYYVAKITYGQTAGYRMTDLTFAGDLICNVGESITSVLDKIKNMLSEFEYFYDLDGQFVFQKKQSFVNTLWTPLKSTQSQENENWEGSAENDILYYTDQYVESMALASSVAYTFNEGELITAFNNNPNILNMRNDYSVWGTRKTAAGVDIPVHLRYAIDTKPTYYKSFNDRYEIKEYDVDSFNNRTETVYVKDANGNYEAFPIESEVLFDETKEYYIQTQKQQEFTIKDYDWREIIYQMAKDYYKYNTEDNFELELRANNLAYYPTGRTGYERYYTDIQGFWRQLYNPEAATLKGDISAKIENHKIEIDNIVNGNEELIKIKDSELTALKDELSKIEDKESLEYKAKENEIIEKESELIRAKGLKYVQNLIKIKEEELTTLKNELLKIENTDSLEYQEKENEILKREQELSITEKTGLKYIENDFLNKKAELEKELILLENQYEDLEGFYSDTETLDKRYWHMDVFEAPHSLNFWFDFLDTEGILSQFNVKTNGARSKAINDNAVKSIYFRETPDVIFINSTDVVELNKSGYKYIQVQDRENMFSISAQGKSAKDRLDELIYQHGYCIENTTITTIPIYYLQPNTRIHIFDQETNLNGDYIISKMTIPLAYNGTMSITATKAAENII